ncbi:MAG: InlB B-repeat-containing protein, partial [Clostridia bacterium]|nr:InlB B-repeat-containing protein [Clostridia bacterium]
MNLAKTKAKYLKCAILIILLCFTVGVISACLPFSIYVPDKLEEDAINDTAYTVTYDSADSLGKFKDKTSYVFTNKDYVDDYRAGLLNAENKLSDMKIITVDATATHGSQLNPYVIADKNDWRKFAKLMETDTSRGEGKYFILINDLDFDGDTFYPVRFFKGTFYGLGHSLKNISVSNWLYLTGSGDNTAAIASTTYGFGIFCQTTGATITDLVVEKFDYQEMPNTPAYGTRAVSNTGGVVGLALLDTWLLNCHTTGNIYSTLKYGRYPTRGGIVGSHDRTTGTILLYRCSSQMTVQTIAETCPMIGGIIGEANNGGTVKVYDCVADLVVSVTGTYMHVGGVAGLMELSTWYTENNLTNISITSTALNAAGALTSVWETSTILNYTNCYNAGVIGSTETNKLPLVSITGSKVLSTANTTAKNVNVAKDPDLSYAATYLNYGDRLNVSGLGRTERDSIDILVAEATKNVKDTDAGTMPSWIWDAEKTSKVSTYWADDYDGNETILDYSPVRNFLIVNVHYYNRTVNNGVETLKPLCYTANNNGEYQQVIAGNALDTIPSSEWAANHKFLGWSTEKTSWADPLTDAIGIFGNIDLYAVWEYTGDTTQSISVTNATVDPNNSDLYTRVYEKNQKVTLTSSININNMNSPALDYQWYKKTSGTESEKVTGTSSTYLLQDVRDSGTYMLEFTYHSAVEPLWYGVKTVDAPEVEITPAQLYLESLTTKDIAYVGMDYKDVEPIAKMYALVSGNKEYITGTTSWRSNSGSILETSVKDGKVTKDVKFLPDDSYNGNYQGERDEGGQAIAYSGTFDVEYLSITFDMFDALGVTMSRSVIKYGDNLAYAYVADLFDAAFAAELEKNPSLADDLAGDSPAFSFEDGEVILVSKYRKKTNSTGSPTTAYSRVVKPIIINVITMPATYTVKFKADENDNNPTVDTNVYRYGMHIVEPPTPSKDGQLFVGWYYNAAEPDSDTAKIDTRWDFARDIIASDMCLTARFLTADRITDLRVTVLNRNIMALDTLKDGDLKVEAYYVGG